MPLLSAEQILERYRLRGGDRGAAVAGALAQVIGLRDQVASDDRWHALVELVRRTGDPWNADDWPLGFDPLVCCIPLCVDVDYECARCPIGLRQEGMSCAHPTSHFGRIGELVRHADRRGLADHLDRLEAVLVELSG